MMWISQKEAMEKYNISTTNLYNWRSNNDIKFKKDNKSFVYDDDTLKERVSKMTGKRIKNKPVVKKSSSKKHVDKNPSTKKQETPKIHVPPKTDEYVPGLDSNLILKGGIFKGGRIELSANNSLTQANKELNTNYSSWEELSKNNLTEEFATKYAASLSWYHFLGYNLGRKYSKEFMKKFDNKFILIRIGCFDE